MIQKSSLLIGGFLAVTQLHSSAATTSPLLSISESPSPNIHVSRFAGADKLAKSATGVGQVPIGVLARIENASDRSVTSLTTIWIATDSTGKKQKLVFSSDSYLTATALPVIRRGTAVIVGPQILINDPAGAPDSLQGTMGAGGLGTALSPLYKSASSLEMQIDSIVFDDGEIVGPNSEHHVEEIQARKRAANDIVNELHGALAAGRSLSDAISSLPATRDAFNPSSASSAQEISLETRFQNHWHNHFLQSLQRTQRATDSRRAQAYLAYLEQLPQPTKMFRNQK